MTELKTGFYPFWFWNDTLKADELCWQIAQMAAQGVRGFFIHSRQGLGQPYMSESFLRMVDVSVEAAKARGLIVHLYDEYPYPSGIAGGAVVLGTPQYYATRLVHVTHEVHGGDIRIELPRGRVLSCQAFPRPGGQVEWQAGRDLLVDVGMVLTAESYAETGLTRYNRKRYFASSPAPVLQTQLPPGDHRICASVQVVVDHFKYWDHYVDVMNPEAVRCYLSLTHERYAQRYADRFGSTIASIFVDEVAPAWSELLLASFADAYGYDLVSAMPALSQADHPDHLRVAYDLYRLQYASFCKAYDGPVSAWCRRHGIAYSGEKTALRLSQLRYMDIPGCEPGHTKVGVRPDWLGARIRSNARSTASAAYFYGKAGSLCECYHSVGWSATLQDAKAIAEGLLLAGISYLVPHGFFYTTHALKKHDAPPTFFFQMPAWPLFGQLSERIERIASLWQGTHMAADVFIIEPTSGMPEQADQAAYENLLWMLMRNHVDFLLVDTDMLEESEIRDGKVRLRDVTARVILLPPMRVVEPSLAEWLARFEREGGRVLRLARDADLAQVCGQVLAIAPPPLRAEAGGQTASDLLLVRRTDGVRTLWFGLNIGSSPLDVNFTRVNALTELPLDPRLPARLTRDGAEYRRDVAPFESFMLEAVPPPVGATQSLPVVFVRTEGLCNIKREAPNLLRMGAWRMALRQPDGGFGADAQVDAIPLANQLAQSHLAFSPVIKRYFGHEPELELPELDVRYTFRFINTYRGDVMLVMEPGSLAGEWRMHLNGSEWFDATAFSPSPAHVRGSLQTDVTRAIVPGENIIVIEVHARRLEDGLRNPLYLAGEFGVALDPVTLVDSRSQGPFEAYEENLMPYYAGVLTYTSHFHLDRIPESEQVLVSLQYDRPFREATEVSLNGSEYQPVLWEPRFLCLPASALKYGDNVLVTRVYTTLIRSFEGQWFDDVDHCYREIGMSFPAEDQSSAVTYSHL